MSNISPVETLREIRANFAALQAELDEARAENARLKEGINGLSKKALQYENDREYNASLVMERDARIAELEAELDAADACAIAQDGRIAELEAARRWVPVGERLPEKRGEYLVRSHYRDDTFIAICEYDPDLIGSGWRTVSWVTHWQPLPAAPEVEG